MAGPCCNKPASMKDVPPLSIRSWQAFLVDCVQPETVALPLRMSRAEEEVACTSKATKVMLVHLAAAQAFLEHRMHCPAHFPGLHQIWTEQA